ncbi:MAG: chemotaxis protein CheD [Hyphomonas sp.]|uniref:chemotaxis protein CheD n=1 Tax=Hyphomonas sp. TaxID=87 RepID=UPI003526DAD9
MQAEADLASGARSIHVIQGTHAVSDDPNTMLVTVLGSCVATCLWDETAGIGGMNHFLLPEATGNDTEATLFGAFAMELLINELLKRGARKDRLNAKLFGGGRIVSGLSDIGAKNAEFARRFLAREGIPCVSESLGGDRGRRIRFWPVTGRAQQMYLKSAVAEQVVAPQPAAPDAGEVSLF